MKKRWNGSWEQKLTILNSGIKAEEWKLGTEVDEPKQRNKS
jgi:hypothetical protein